MTVEAIVQMLREMAPFEQVGPHLDDIHEESDFGAIADALRQESEAVREHAMRAFGDTDNPISVEALSRFYRDPSEQVRIAAFTAVDRLDGDVCGGEDIADAIYHDPSPAVRVRAVWALAHAAEPRAREYLERALEMELPIEVWDAVERALAWLASLPS